MSADAAAFAALAAASAAGSDPLQSLLLSSELAARAAGAGSPMMLLSPLDVLTLTQAGEYLQLPEHTVRAEAESGRLTGRCINGEWRFVRDEIVAWLRVPRRNTMSSVVGILTDETDEERAAFLANIQAHRDEIDRATGSGKYAPE